MSSDLGQGASVAASPRTGSQQPLPENKTSLCWDPERS